MSPEQNGYAGEGRPGGGAVLAGLAREDPRVRVVTLDRNRGQSTALLAGFDACRAPWVATLDADGQNDPRDLIGLWETVSPGEVDGVIGVRVNRADDRVRKVSSRVANAVRNRVLGDHVTDVGCSSRIVSRQALRALPRFEGMHRFLPTLVRSAGHTLVEAPVRHHPRATGESKYGIHDRLWRGLADLWTVRRLLERSSRRAPARERRLA